VLATQNPIEFEGTYPLPEAQRDRFLLKVSIDYPEPDDEAEILFGVRVDPTLVDEVEVTLVAAGLSDGEVTQGADDLAAALAPSRPRNALVMLNAARSR